MIFFFFFQAEDGIRDYKVTGVQTCALPICLVTPSPSRGRWLRKKSSLLLQLISRRAWCLCGGKKEAGILPGLAMDVREREARTRTARRTGFVAPHKLRLIDQTATWRFQKWHSAS